MRWVSLAVGLAGAGVTVWGSWLGARLKPLDYVSLHKLPGLYAQAQRPEDTHRYIAAVGNSSRWVAIGAAIQFVAVVLAFIAAV